MPPREVVVSGRVAAVFFVSTSPRSSGPPFAVHRGGSSRPHQAPTVFSASSTRPGTQRLEAAEFLLKGRMRPPAASASRFQAIASSRRAAAAS